MAFEGHIVVGTYGCHMENKLQIGGVFLLADMWGLHVD